MKTIGEKRESGPTGPEIVLRIDKLAVRAGRRRILEDVSFEVPEKQITAIIGPSGSGKSVLLKSITRLLEEENVDIANWHYDGHITFRDEQILGLSAKEIEKLRSKIVYVSQSPVALPMDIYGNMKFALEYWNPNLGKGDIEERITAALEQAELWKELRDRLRQSPKTLSAGQLQRLCIARALALRPDILLLDEPSAFIDHNSPSRIELLLVDLKSVCTILIVTHNMQQAARVADVSLFLLLGKIIERTSTEKMFTNPDEKLTEDYITGRFG